MSRSPAKITISSTQHALRVPRRQIAALVDAVARAEDVILDHVDIAVVSADQIARINRQHLSHRGPTDVISFDLSGDEDAGVVAQLIVCADLAVREGPKHGHRPQHELLLYVVHGLLHVMGYDDVSDPLAAAMRRRQEELLTGFLAAWRRRRR
ncbi:MAG: rRNA maturation RNase YbeY [Planctomycetota bacterium]